MVVHDCRRDGEFSSADAGVDIGIASSQDDLHGVYPSALRRPHQGILPRLSAGLVDAYARLPCQQVCNLLVVSLSRDKQSRVVPLRAERHWRSQEMTPDVGICPQTDQLVDSLQTSVRGGGEESAAKDGMVEVHVRAAGDHGLNSTSVT